VPYGTEVTPERLGLIERGEAALRHLGFQQFRVRLHDKLARVESLPKKCPARSPRKCPPPSRKRSSKPAFTYVALDLEGYRQGSLNESLKPQRA